jgi:hypothetical protein
MDPHNNPGGGPVPGAPPQVPIPPPVTDMMAELATAMATLANVSTMQLANSLSKAKLVQKPSLFKGEHGTDVHRFLAAFTMWAMAQGTALNVVDQQGTAVDHRDMEWICAALSYLQNDTSIWAAPAMEEFADGGIPFGGLWVTFQEQFKARFETVDEAVDAKEKLRVLWQDNSSVPEYAALFKELMTRTRYSSADLQDRFYEHLSTCIKDELVHTARPIGTLDELVTVASSINVCVRQRRAEKEREKKCSGLQPGRPLRRPLSQAIRSFPQMPNQLLWTSTPPTPARSSYIGCAASVSVADRVPTPKKKAVMSVTCARTTSASGIKTSSVWTSS